MDSSCSYDELKEKTIPGLLLERMKRTPDQVAYRAKKLGIYRERTWSELVQMVCECAMALRGLGLRPGERLAGMGDPSEECLVCDLATQALGAVSYWIYPGVSQKELSYLMVDGGATVFVAENLEYVDRVLPIFEDLSTLDKVIVIDTKGTFHYDHSDLFSFEELISEGKKRVGSVSDVFKHTIHQVMPQDTAFIAYTAGSTGPPKGIRVSHGRHLAAAYTFIDRYPILREIPQRTVAYLPISHMLGRVAAITLPLITNIVPHYGESIEDLGRTLFETAPTALFTVPRYLQEFGSTISANIRNSTPLKKFFYSQAMSIGRQRLERLWHGRKSAFSEVLYSFAHWAVFRPILNKLGFNKIKIAISSDSPLSPDVMTLWQTYGVNLTEVYTQAESGGAVITGQESFFPRPGRVGKPPAAWEVRLSEKGEILAKGSNVLMSYLGQGQPAGGMKEHNGWIHTGDLGEWTPEGDLRITERVGGTIRTPGGEVIFPTAIENRLKFSPYIREAIVIGENRVNLCALIELDFEVLSEWMQSNDIPSPGLDALAGNPAVVDLIGSEIEKANVRLPAHERIVFFRIIPKPLDPAEDDAPITPTRKIKRDLMHEAFKDLIESMYREQECSVTRGTSYAGR